MQTIRTIIPPTTGVVPPVATFEDDLAIPEFLDATKRPRAPVVEQTTPAKPARKRDYSETDAAIYRLQREAAELHANGPATISGRKKRAREIKKEIAVLEKGQRPPKLTKEKKSAMIAKLGAALRGAKTKKPKAAPAAKKPTTKKAKVAKASGKKPAREPGGKAEIVVGLLKRKATVDELCKATGWQPHSLRSFLSVTIATKLEHDLKRERKEGVTTYWID